jgi:glycine/D-amino acid oxidase-like deaminating enzyme
MNLSYWEKKTWFSNIDFCVIGSGIVGLSCALQLRKDYPNSKILVLERGILPKGASTKNAGFACYGSVSELLFDLENHSTEEVFQLVKSRHEGLILLRENLGDRNLAYEENGGFEVFLKEDRGLFENCKNQLTDINQIVEPVFGKKTFKIISNYFGFKKCIHQLILNPFEGQIDTGLMMMNLLKKAQSQNIMVLNGVEVKDFSADKQSVQIILKDFSFKVRQLFLATNAFADQFLDLDLKPVRNQVIITEPIPGLNIKGVFHMNKGYYYFRNVNNRILLGGGRHLDAEIETTSEFGVTNKIQQRLNEILRNLIIPDIDFRIDQAWSGILGVGNQKKPIIKSVEDNVHLAVRLGGMGVAIGSKVGYDLAKLLKHQ